LHTETALTLLSPTEICPPLALEKAEQVSVSVSRSLNSLSNHLRLDNYHLRDF